MQAVCRGCQPRAKTVLCPVCWSEQGGVSLSVTKAEAQRARVYIRSGYAVNAVYVDNPSWYAVRAYYMGGPWGGLGYSYTGWPDYAARNGIGCTPGTCDQGRGRHNVQLPIAIDYSFATSGQKAGQ